MTEDLTPAQRSGRVVFEFFDYGHKCGVLADNGTDKMAWQFDTPKDVLSFYSDVMGVAQRWLDKK